MQFVWLEFGAQRWVRLWHILGRSSRFFIDIMFLISQCWLCIPVVLVLDTLPTLNKLHSAGSIKISFSGQCWHSVRRNYLLVQQNTEHFWDWQRNVYMCIDFFKIIFYWIPWRPVLFNLWLKPKRLLQVLFYVNLKGAICKTWPPAECMLQTNISPEYPLTAANYSFCQLVN